MSTKAFTIKNFYLRNIPIDDGFEGDAVASGETFPIRIARFSVQKLQDFQRGYARLNAPTSTRFIFRKPDGDEQALREDQTTHVVPNQEIQRRRLEEMTSETRAAYEAAIAADDAFMTTFCSEAIAAHVSVAPDFTLRATREGGDEEFQVKSGKDLVEAFGGNLSMLVRLTRAIHQENTLTPEAKKALRSLSGLMASSPTPAAAAGVGGATPAATAMPVEAGDSAPSGAALEGLDQSQSGSAKSVMSTSS